MRKEFKTSCILTGLFIALIVLLKTAGLEIAGPDQTVIGLSFINVPIMKMIPMNMFFYKLTEVLGYGLLCIGAFFGVCGLLQWIRRRSLLKVDRELILTGVLYVITIVFYVLFDKVAVNFRPVIMPGDTMVEASFPSSHTMLSIVMLGSAYLLTNVYIHKAVVRRHIQIASLIVMAAVVIGRLLSGVHWPTDILGGVLLAGALVYAYAGLLDGLYEKK